MRIFRLNWVRQHAVALAMSTTMAASVVYFDIMLGGVHFPPLFLVPYISVVLIAYISGAWLDKKLAPHDSLLLNLYTALLVGGISVFCAGQLFGVALAIRSLLQDQMAVTLVKSIQFGAATSIMFVFGSWPLLVPMTAASVVTVFLLRRITVGS